MALIAKSSGSGGFPPMEAGTYPAICYAVIDIGEQYSAMYGNTARKMIIIWEIPGELIEIDGEMKPRAKSATYTLSLGEKANLRKVLENWRGKKFTEDELDGFNVSKLLGAPCLLNIVHEVSRKTGQTYANVGGVSQLPKGMDAPKPFNPQMAFDLDEPDALEKMKNLPEWIQDRIKESVTYKNMAQPDKDVRDAADDGDYSQIDDSEDLPF